MRLPQDVIEIGYIKLYKAPAAVVTDAVKVVFGIGIFWIFKDWLFTKLYELSGWTFAQKWAGINFLFWPALLIVGLIILNLILMWVTNYYEIFPDRIVIKAGGVSQIRRSFEIDQFVALEVTQRFWGRLLGYGDILLIFKAITTVVTKQGIVMRGVRQSDSLIDSVAKYIQNAKLPNRGAIAGKRARTVMEAVSETSEMEVESGRVKNQVVEQSASADKNPVIRGQVAAESLVKPLKIEGEIDFSK